MSTQKKDRPDLMFAQLSELYFFENQLAGGLARMAEAATHPDLKALFEEHGADTMDQVKRLEVAFSVLKTVPKAFPTQTVDGLMEDTRWLIHTIEKGPALDAALCTAARRTEALEAVMYRNLIHSARAGGKAEVAALCEQTLKEELAAEEAMVSLMFTIDDQKQQPTMDAPLQRPVATRL